MKYLCYVILLATLVAGRFSDDFYRVLLKDNEEKNIIVSPVSVEILLSMVSMGASGKTAQELREVLQLAEDKAEVAEKYKDFLTNLEKREKVAILDIANRIYINDQHSIVPKFNQITRNAFKAEAVAINLKSPNEAALIVNKWVTDQTCGRITHILNPDIITSDLVAVLLNAIYFKGKWQYQFKAKDTKKEKFELYNGISKLVPMMSQEGRFKAAYIDHLNAKVIELPYSNSSLSMLIFLPNKVDGLRELEKKILGFSPRLVKQNVIVKLPKFKIEFSAQLKSVLVKVGIRKAFDGSDDFNGLVLGPNVSIGQVMQKAFIEVTEEGTEAAAVTGATMMNIRQFGTPPPPMQFIADHPFAYVICDKSTIFFRGHVTNLR